jgi:transmembrane sensor
VAPGGNKAILTLGDGSTIALDSAANGSLAQQGNSAVVKLAGGQLAYRPTGAANDIVVMNTMSTPRGGQYQLTLPDGTKAWLNAASSITFPTAFVTAQRKIKIKGEVYLEVAQEAAKPFIVDIDGRSVVEVLGTSFNINSYADEAAIKTTLIEGNVRIKTNDRNILLKPGQQAVDMQLVNNADIAQVLAWKNGVFNFENLNFREVARQLERWYDIEVVYEGRVPDIQFKGDMNRGVSLTGVLRIFTAFGVHTRIEGRKLIVM